MNNIWTISINGGAYVTLDSLGVNHARRHLVNMDADTVSLTVLASRALDAAPLFEYGDTIRIRRNGVNWFRGFNISNPRTGSPRSESITYTIANAWWDLSERIYLQNQAIYVEGLFQLQRKPHVFLGYKTLWHGGINPQCAYAGIKTSIQDILDFAIANGAPLVYDISLIPDIVTPVCEDRNISCADAIKRFLKWIPDFVVCVDYSTDPPTLKFKRRGDLSAINFSLGTPPLSTIDITPRYDLQRPCVKIYWERIDSIDGAQVPIEQIEIYPPTATGLERGAYIASVDLLGYSSSSTSGKVQIAQFDASVLGFWASRFPSHHDGETRQIKSISSVQYSWKNTAAGIVIDTKPPYGHMITDGTWYAWMPFHAIQVTCQCQAYIEYYDQTGVIQNRNENLSCQVISCDAAINSETQGYTTYSTLASYESGEDVPARKISDTVSIPLSQDIFSAVGPLHYSGTIQLAEVDCGDWSPNASNLIGCGLNITGGAQPDWATMNAMVQSIDEDWGSGSTSINIGPPEHLSPQDLKDLCALTRSRYKFHNPSMMSGTSLAAGKIDITSSGSGNNASTNGLMGFGTLNVDSPKGAIAMNSCGPNNTGIQFSATYPYSNPDAPQNGIDLTWEAAHPTATRQNVAVTINTNDLGKHNAKFRPLPFCTLDGHQLTILVCSSQPFDSSGAEHDPFETTTVVPS